MKYIFDLPYPISVNRMWRKFRNVVVLSAEGRQWKEQCAILAKQQGVAVINGEVQVSVILRPKLTKKGAASKTIIDLDNLCKCLDGLNGVAYTDDKMIKRWVLGYGAPCVDGGMTIKVETFGD